MRRPIGNHDFADTVCLALATLLFGCSILEARAAASGTTAPGQTGSDRKATLKERILEIPPGTTIEVRLLNKQRIRGRLGEITDDGFSLTTVQGDKIATQRIAFTELKSFKKLEGGKAGHAVLYGLAGLGVLLVVITVWAAVAASGSD
jgi:hypothetical protein